MTEHDALTLLSQRDQRFFDDFAKRCVYARLVMQGLARCYVVMGGEEYIRLATDEEQALSRQYSAQAEILAR